MALKIASVNLMALENSKAHRTFKFENVHLNPPTPIFRRGQEFEFDVKFSNRPYNSLVDKLRVLFYYEDDYEANIPKGGVWLTNNQDTVEDMEMWSLRMITNEEKTLKLRLRTPVRTAIGCWKMAIKCDLRSHLASETYEHPETIYLLLNPWHKDDEVYMPETHLLEEYIMNDIGKVYTGDKNSVIGRHWLFGQFEAHVLPIYREILQNTSLSFDEKANPINLAKALFRLRRDILYGNWGERSFDDGTPPWMWTGSAPILKEYAETNEKVKYAQCWIFAAVACSLCRAIGIPARVVSNIGAAIDYDYSLTIDVYYDENGKYIEGISEKVWTFHSCTDIWMARPDLPTGYGGWQFLDTTNALGPASLEAIKSGEVGQPCDVQFKISEVNADIVYWKKDEKALLDYRKTGKNTNGLGYFMLTKKPHIFDPNGNRDQEDVMNLYKNPEGSKEERLALYNAAFKCGEKACEIYEIKLPEESETEMKFSLVNIDTIYIGNNFFIALDMENTANEKRNIQIGTTIFSRYYNGVKGYNIKNSCETVEIAPKSKKQFKIEVTAEDYIGRLVELCFLKTYIMATVQETNEVWSGEEEFQISKPSLTVKVQETLKTNEKGIITFSLKNPLKRPLTECQIAFDCPGLLKYEKLPFRNILSEEDVKMETYLTPKEPGKFYLVALFHCKELQDLMGSSTIEVSSS